MSWKIVTYAIGVTVTTAIALDTSLSKFPLLRPNYRLDNERAKTFWARLEGELGNRQIVCGELLGIVRRGGLSYLEEGKHYYSDPAYVNLWQALEKEHSKNRQLFSRHGHDPDSDCLVHTVTSPGYRIYNRFGLRIRHALSGEDVCIRDLIKEYLDQHRD